MIINTDRTMNTAEFARAAYDMIFNLEALAYELENVWHRDVIMAPNGRLIEVKCIRANNLVMVVNDIDGTYTYLHVVKHGAFNRVMLSAGFVRKVSE